MGIMASSLLIQGLSGHRGHGGAAVSALERRRARRLHRERQQDADLKKMVKLFDEGKLKVCVDEHFAFDEVKEALSKSLTARSGGKLVIDVASPAPSETCCVVA